MKNEQQLRAWFEHEQRYPRQAVTGALEFLGLENGDRVVDVGCGPGVHIPQILDRVAPDGKVVGVDTDGKRLAVAANLLAKEIQAGKVDLIKANLNSPNSALQEFDHAWISMVIHHERTPVDAVRNIKKLLRSGGQIAILEGDDAGSFPYLTWPPTIERRIREAVYRAASESNDDSPTSIRHFTGRKLPSILADAGLTDIRIRVIADTRQAPLDDWDQDDIQDWFLRSLGSRIRAFLAPADWEIFEEMFTPGTNRYVLDRPEFFIARSWTLAVGTAV